MNEILQKVMAKAAEHKALLIKVGGAVVGAVVGATVAALVTNASEEVNMIEELEEEHLNEGV